MGKIVVKAKKDGFELINHISYPETLSQQMKKTINSGKLTNLLSVESKEIGKKTELKCVARNVVSLDAFLSSGVTKKVFFNALNQIVSVLQSCKDFGLQTNTLLLNKQQMFWDQTEGRVLCVFWPVVNSTYRNNLGEFFSCFPRNVLFSDKIRESFLSDYYSFFGGERPFSLTAFSKMVSRYSGNHSADRSVHSMEKQKDTSAEQEIRPLQEHEYNPFSRFQNARQFPETCNTAVLIRSATNEKIIINSFPFVVGRLPECCDYALPNNPGISAQHFELLNNNQSFQMCDLNSKNKTFLNGQLLQPGLPVTVQNNAEIRAANETFTFLIPLH